ncbi:UDP-N-acetylglucosamine 2-epimerase (non-hydrolyzing) [Pseudomonas defluvii]|nr:UDP-N-acetylglucosamine 2-epimerase (non-hydrolyzing) [Pseudomonas defluvii]
MPYKVVMVFGTRPEAIKMAPLARVLRQWPDIALNICSSGQHREMLDQVLKDFGLTVDIDLQVMTDNQSLNGLSQQLLGKLDLYYERVNPDIVLVHGDTTTSFIAALCAFNRHIPIAHVEAGLRTGNLKAPWPEEANRRLTTIIADLHFPPTKKARDNLLHEGIVLEQIEVTGNTVIDALLWMREHLKSSHWKPATGSPLSALRDDQRMVLITGHRRENFGHGFERICLAIAELALRYPDVQFVYPVHLNPHVQKAVYSVLSHQPNILLVAPQDYRHFVWLMDRAYLILSDSGGIQEEAPALGKPLLVLRKVTERPSVLEGGTVLLVGTQTERIVKETSRLLEEPDLYQHMSRVLSPYGDGHASERIAERLSRWLEDNANGREMP